mmetsp:Transcript_21342/g.24545  ORF Transcript_21342/g.24545 Transcript_21342/m.24545 type:complete len:105 (-) Transcript_21342:1463-1777(-)
MKMWKLHFSGISKGGVLPDNSMRTDGALTLVDFRMAHIFGTNINNNIDTQAKNINAVFVKYEVDVCLCVSNMTGIPTTMTCIQLAHATKTQWISVLPPFICRAL